MPSNVMRFEIHQEETVAAYTAMVTFRHLHLIEQISYRRWIDMDGDDGVQLIMEDKFKIRAFKLIMEDL